MAKVEFDLPSVEEEDAIYQSKENRKALIVPILAIVDLVRQRDPIVKSKEFWRRPPVASAILTFGAALAITGGSRDTDALIPVMMNFYAQHNQTPFEPISPDLADNILLMIAASLEGWAADVHHCAACSKPIKARPIPNGVVTPEGVVHTCVQNAECLMKVLDTRAVSIGQAEELERQRRAQKPS